METEFLQGEEFYIKDMEEQFELTVEAASRRIIPPPYINEELIYEKLRQMGITLKVDKNAITTACRSLTNSQTVIVRGKKMIPPINGQVKYMFDNKERVYKERAEDEGLDFFYRGDINSVEKGEVLAVIIPPIPGEPGLTVTGDVIPTPEVEHAKIYVGKGAKLVDDGQVAIAEISGRPATKGSKKNNTCNTGANH